jgi:hypothetical protein
MWCVRLGTITRSFWFCSGSHCRSDSSKYWPLPLPSSANSTTKGPV